MPSKRNNRAREVNMEFSLPAHSNRKRCAGSRLAHNSREGCNESLTRSIESMCTILLVEDNPVSRLMFSGLLARTHQVIEAGSAEDARETLRRQKPDLILMDVQLPGLDGLSFTRKLKADPSTANIPIVA